MSATIGLDIGTTYTKGVILDENRAILARHMKATGSQLQQTAATVVAETAEKAGLARADIAYCITTGYGRHQYEERDLQVTDLTATARGASFLFPGTRTVLDIGGQTMKASRIDDKHKVQTFRLNDKCASGTGMFLEKTVRYMGYNTEDIDGLLQRASGSVPISGVCTVFAESEVINHLSNSVPAANIMYGAGLSLTKRSVQLLKRIQVEDEVTLLGGILRWEVMAAAIKKELGRPVNVPSGDMPQYAAALGCALLGHISLGKLRDKGEVKRRAA